MLSSLLHLYTCTGYWLLCCILLQIITDAVEHFKVIISEDESPSAWQPAYSGLVDADDTKVPECTEKLMAMIKGIEGT